VADREALYRVVRAKNPEWQTRDGRPQSVLAHLEAWDEDELGERVVRAPLDLPPAALLDITHSWDRIVTRLGFLEAVGLVRRSAKRRLSHVAMGVDTPGGGMYD
jgi:hypothetical protein